MKKLIEFMFGLARLLGAVCLIVIFVSFIWAMIRAVIEIVKDDYERKRISSTNKKDNI